MRYSKTVLIVLVVLVACFAEPPCRFAKQYTTNDLLTSSAKRTEFMRSVAYWESKFHQHRIGYNAISGLTYDGTQIDFDTGLPHDPLHDFSASSKESLHLHMLAHALKGTDLAQIFIHGEVGKAAATKSLDILARKISSYEDFDRRYPGFGGFLPWFKVADDGIHLLSDQMWKDHIPALDNGQLVWGLIVVAQELEKYDSALAHRYWNYVSLMKKTMLTIFYEGDGKIRAVASIHNVTSKPTTNNYWNDSPHYLLDDPYEGELFAFLLDLYGDWKTAGYNDGEREKIWIRKRAKLQQATFVMDNGNKITVERGYWHSSHEKWKYFVLPYTSVPINRRVFLNGERARTVYSMMKHIPGLFASVTKESPKYNYSVVYISACGIQAIASQPVLHSTTVTPYGAFPVILANQSVGLAWYNMMLNGPSMQGPLGSTEAVNTTGTAISPVVTWDSKITTLVSMIGGVSAMAEQIMRKDGVFPRFYNIIEREWGMVFTNLEGEEVPLHVPYQLQLPTSYGDFTTCR